MAHEPAQIPIALFVGPMLIGLALLLVYEILLGRCFTRLRDLHPDVWKTLGRPHSYGNDRRDVVAARAFLWSHRGRGLGDDILYRRARAAYLCGVVGATMFGLPIVIGISVKLLVG